MTHYDPNRPADPRDLPGARRSDDPLNPPEPVVHDAAPVRSGGEARQAPPGRPVLYVLIAGLVLALIAWAAVELYPRGGNTIADVKTQDVTGSTPREAGGIPISPPEGSPEGSASQGQTAPGAPGRGQVSGPSPTSDSAR
ncbi:MAG: hypothetical protein ACK4MV_04185 [Beijerinckiaceae bacterium]